MRRLLTVVAMAVGLAAVLGRPPAAADPAWGWPLPGRPLVLRAFDAPATPFAAGHRGADLGAPVGTPVLAAGAGVVAFSGRVAGRGVVSIDHGRLRTTYEPVIGVAASGQPVRRGEQIGWLATPTGHCGIGVSCLHWGLRRGAAYLNPLALVGAGPVRLLPLDSPSASQPAATAAPRSAPLAPARTPVGTSTTAPPAARRAQQGSGQPDPPAPVTAGVAGALGLAAALALARARSP